jgi:hypothetical protein
VKFTPGELYVIGELDLRTNEKTNYYKVGIVREKRERTSAERLKDHQTGNPRELFVYDFIKCKVVEEVETVFHRLMASKGVRGEWLELSEAELAEAILLINRLNADVIAEYSFFEKAEELKSKVSREELIPASDEIVQWQKRYAEADVRSKAAGRILKTISDALKGAAAAGVDLEHILDIQPKEGQRSIDKDSLKEKHPDLFAKYLISKESPKQRFTPTIPNEIKENLAHIDSHLFSITESLDAFIEQVKAKEHSYQELHGRYLEILSIEADADWAKTIAEARLKSACADAGGIDGVCKWSRSVETKQVFDDKLFREEHPDLAEQFTKSGPSTQAVIVNPKRGY